jgi:uncharacterized protein
MVYFIGRKNWLYKLNALAKTDRPILAVMMGRRRVGKSRLAAEFAKDKIFLSFSGIAPVDGVTAQDQRDAFARKIYTFFKEDPFTFKDWSDGFDHITSRLTHKPTVILLDEISWMGHKDPLFIAKLKNWWDLSLQKFPNLTLILCGSVSTWIERNIIKSTALFGRISLKIPLEELSLADSCAFLRHIGFKGSEYEIFKILSITGGIPWYIEQINPQLSADENIRQLFLEEGGIFYEEYNHIFHDLFENKGQIYRYIVEKLAQGVYTLKQLKVATEYANSGSFSQYMQNLVTSGFVKEHASWSIDSGRRGKQKLYRLKDNYLRFYLRYVAQLGSSGKVYTKAPLETLAGWDTIMGLQVENLLLNNHDQVLHAIGINPANIMEDGPYYQAPTKQKKGCQIDYMVQTRSKNLYICEFKFSRREIGSAVLESMQDKIKALRIPRGMGICPVLVHASGVTEEVDTAKLFYRILDMRDLLTQ